MPGPHRRRRAGVVVAGVVLCVAAAVVAGVLLTTRHPRPAPAASAVGAPTSARVPTSTPAASTSASPAPTVVAAAGRGTVSVVTIPATVSGFPARPARVWLPPAWQRSPRPALPAVELLAGTPSTTNDWISAGLAQQTADAFAAAHDGVAPILVMADLNGTERGDTECVDSPRGRAETYLTVDVPNFVRATYGATSLAVAGLSEGGTCAIMLALRHQTLFPAFADLSGLAAPTVGDHVQKHATTVALFGGSDSQYLAHEPSHLLHGHSFRGLGGLFSVGTSDVDDLAAQEQLVPPARAAGIDVCVANGPGTHGYGFWSTAFRQVLPWLAWRLGLVPAAVGQAACSG